MNFGRARPAGAPTQQQLRPNAPAAPSNNGLTEKREGTGEALEPWHHRAVLDANLHAESTIGELYKVEQELKDTQFKLIDSECRRKKSEDQLDSMQSSSSLGASSATADKVREQMSIRLQSSEMQVTKLQEELNALRRGASANFPDAEQVAGLKEELARMRAQLLRAEARAQDAEAYRGATTPPTPRAPTGSLAQGSGYSAPLSGSGPSTPKTPASQTDMDFLRVKLSETARQLTQADRRAKTAEANAQVQEERAQVAEARNVELALDTSRHLKMLEAAQEKTSNAEADSRAMLTKFRELQGQIAKLKSEVGYRPQGGNGSTSRDNFSADVAHSADSANYMPISSARAAYPPGGQACTRSCG